MASNYPPLYKYMNKEHAEKFWDDGTIRIGTLFEYRNIDKHGEEVGELSEAMAYCIIHKSQLNRVARDETTVGGLSEFVKNMVKSSPEAIYSDNFIVGYSPLDQYIYCCTSEYSEESMNLFGYDSCIKISDVSGFISCVTECLGVTAKFKGAFYCQYRERGFKFEESPTVYPEIIKHPNYAHQKEVRVIWHPKYENIRPQMSADDYPVDLIEAQIVSLPNLTKFCQKV